ncbi:hypothetical protein SAMN06272735_8630 [Streptomyces sp. TLI_55]|nr:hypothetical protein SAMN06272735_8630 [Streptomyces sp. TLI_55]
MGMTGRRGRATWLPSCRDRARRDGSRGRYSPESDTVACMWLVSRGRHW